MSGSPPGYACIVAGRAITEITMLGNQQLAEELAATHAASFDLVHGLAFEPEATTAAAQGDARRSRDQALARLRGSGPPNYDNKQDPL
jgi:hypothetical protein